MSVRMPLSDAAVMVVHMVLADAVVMAVYMILSDAVVMVVYMPLSDAVVLVVHMHIFRPSPLILMILMTKGTVFSVTFCLHPCSFCFCRCLLSGALRAPFPVSVPADSDPGFLKKQAL